ncbi:MAG: FAD-dependent oxidoreductase [Anaerolineae bacterium]|nr:FAD-dependent oxidoreductase [Anaerolineae bacterium]
MITGTTARETRVIILGAGYAGMMAALRLSGKTNRKQVLITLVNATDAFIDRIRLHQFITNQSVKARSIVHMLRGTGVAFVRGQVVALDANRHAVMIETPTGIQQLTYDYLVYALGSAIDRDSVPGVRDYAYTLATSGARSVTALREQLALFAEGGRRVLVCGGGLTGLETVSEIAEAYPNLRVHLATSGTLGEAFNPQGQAYLRQQFAQLGITVHEYAEIRQVQADQAVTTSGAILPFDLCVWTGGFMALPLAREAGLAVNECGQILTDPYLRAISQPHIFAAGDSANPAGSCNLPIRMSCYTALPMGAHVADSLAAVLQGKPPQPFGLRYVAQCVSLGRRVGLVSNVYPDDRAKNLVVTGWLGALVKEGIMRSIPITLSLERLLPGVYQWAGKDQATAPTRAAYRQAERIV